MLASVMVADEQAGQINEERMPPTNCMGPTHSFFNF